ncbi:ubiquinol-cytochrome C chaperone family protein [Rhodospira trueperi]|uniref:Cytochrome b pre-mRNA-processing protein 3 n=1 Tax=Rhodospira trueperi TaxID=69960 RepID=A0A1G6WTS1_9PROT|nr:ubiquinol-cytochrome C chaperone family protein [Rhodospira trueperi]SDD69043.1 cytochrome b pre-mRNA-processing protein 3 [Rhodospira trueperi]
MFSRLFGARSRERAQSRAVVEALYAEVVRRTRQPVFYLDWGVPDTLDGRYDMLVLHMHAIFRRLGALQQEQAQETGGRKEETEAAGLSQALFDHMIRDLDSNLREAGVSDMRIGSRMKKLARGFYGRVTTYDAALSSGDDAALRDALDRNVYQKVAAPPEALAALTAYVRDVMAAADGWTWESLSRGVVRYPDPAGPSRESAS